MVERGAAMRLRIVFAAVLALAVLVAIPAAFAGKPGNSPNAKLCQKNGWQTHVRADGSAFANEEDCVSYAAKGGVLYPASSAPCLVNGGYTKKATASGDPFASLAACEGY